MKEKFTLNQSEKWNSTIDHIEKHMGELAREYMEKSFLLELVKDFWREDYRKEMEQEQKENPQSTSAMDRLRDMITTTVKGLEKALDNYDTKEKDKEEIKAMYTALKKAIGGEQDD